ncbi:MAG: L-histidine N(alpha)-methyltransferase [Candidatus Porifericomitaceae bacterium WSBS_2022_MAG_OTU9]
MSGITCTTVKPSKQLPEMADEILDGLRQKPRTMPCKFLYDAHGSQLFEAICECPEYYQTRTEKTLLEDNALSIIDHCRPNEILELGSGSSVKTVHLLDACHKLGLENCLYSPFDISESILDEAASRLAASYPWLNITPLLGDYNAGMDHMPKSNGRKRLVVFLGGTLGNMKQGEDTQILEEIKKLIYPDGYLLVGVDRAKDIDTLHAAYNDQAGITARFNLNSLKVANRELGGNFKHDEFSHEAVFAKDKGRIEMRLKVHSDQDITLAALDHSFQMKRDEYLLTEISKKFSKEGIEKLLGSAGLEVVHHYEPQNCYFSLLLAQLCQGASTTATTS